MFACSLVSLLGLPRHACAQVQAGGGDSSQLHWKDEWTRFRPAQTLVTSVLLMGAIAGPELIAEPESSRWRGGVLLDDAARQTLGSGSYTVRSLADHGSDVVLIGTMFYPFVVDAALMAWGAHGSPEVAAQMMAINMQSFALTALVTQVSKNFFGRQRPYGDGCATGEAQGQNCDGLDRNRSFVSGHTSFAFTGAGLICAHNSNLPLYGDEPAGGAACATAMGAASTVGLLRIAADRHHLTDVVAGAALGMISGYLLPTLLHYRSKADPGQKSSSSLAPLASPSSVGVSYAYTF